MKKLITLSLIIAVFSVVCFKLAADNQRLIIEKQAQSMVLGEKVNALTISKHKLVLKNREVINRNKKVVRGLVEKRQSLVEKSQYLINELTNRNQVLIEKSQYLVKNSNQFENCFAATCRVSVKDGRGTGCSFRESKNSIFIITNAHVVGNYKTAYCEFWRNGHLLKPIKGEVVTKNKSKDTAVISINKTDLPRNFKIATVPLAPPNYLLKKGQTIASVGCVLANWPSLFKGHFIAYKGSDILFLPKPEAGRSGSAIFDEKGKMIVGLLWGRSDTGHAKSLQTIYPIVIPLEKEKEVERKLFYLTSSTCSACQKQAPIIEQLIKEGYNFEIINVNTPEGMNNMHVPSVPTIVIGDQKIIGFHSYEDLKKLLND